MQGRRKGVARALQGPVRPKNVRERRRPVGRGRRLCHPTRKPLPIFSHTTTPPLSSLQISSSNPILVSLSAPPTPPVLVRAGPASLFSPLPLALPTHTVPSPPPALSSEPTKSDITSNSPHSFVRSHPCPTRHVRYSALRFPIPTYFRRRLRAPAAHTQIFPHRLMQSS
ncbi:hypothetical protein BV25DRAFT_1216388 [Artomyces pyxidatus]|uniref:Uncharacterized protein n=1 Tax=Artomyces pyxidatus TaxID=48021 RepID=A0ACB8SQ93_9AGAM|nr:hypothetical protein BV25DRAFT_1216388 [Artomyces pyxidatus]